MLEKLNKLKQISLAEVRERARQRASIIAERVGLASQAKTPTDREFLKQFSGPNGEISSRELIRHFRSRKAPAFYSSFDDPAETVGALRRRFPADVELLTEKANRICEGYFDLLGYEDLYFNGRIPDWHFDPITQKNSPKIHWSRIDELSPEHTGDKKVIWELNRHQYFSTLGRAYWITNDERFPRALAEHLEDWLQNNPRKVGVNWLSSLEIAFRSMSWIWAFHFCKRSRSVSSDLWVDVLKCLYSNGHHLESYLSTYSSPNTHLTGEALGLFCLGAFMPELPIAKRWKKLGLKILLAALDFQVRDDGVYCEQSSYYHRYTTDFYVNLMILLQIDGHAVEPRLKERIDQLLDFLIHIQQPNGETPLFGDDDGGRLYFLDERPVNDFRSTLALGATLLDRGDLKFVSQKASAELLWLLGPRGLERFDNIVPSEPEEKCSGFSTSGFFAVRDSWKPGSSCLLVDGGTHGFLNGGHAHADGLSLIWSACGEPVFVDSGTFTYTADPEARDRFRSASAHNCLTVDGRSSSIPNGAFTWKSTANTSLIEWNCNSAGALFCGTHDGYEVFNVGYERQVRFDAGGSLTVTDSLRMKELHLIEIHFILSPHLYSEIDGTKVTVSLKETGQLLVCGSAEIVGAEGVGADWRIEPWSVSYRYGSQVETTKLVLSVRSCGAFSICTNFRRPAG